MVILANDTYYCNISLPNSSHLLLHVLPNVRRTLCI